MGFDAKGIDVDEDGIGAAKAQFPQCAFENIGIEALAERKETYDFLYCSEVIEHLSSVDGFFAWHCRGYARGQFDAFDNA